MSSSGRPSRPRRGNRRGWTSLDHYLGIHDAQLARLGTYFVEDHDLQVELTAPDRVTIAGRIRCQHGLFVDVRKVLELNDRQQVRGLAYKYHAGIVGSDPRPIFRYDNAHTYAREGHPDAFHRHRYDHRSWQEIAPPEWIGDEQWPTLAEAIEELHDWWLEVGQFLEL